MFCSKCGAKAGQEDKFCPKCGHSLGNDKDEKKAPVSSASGPNSSSCGSCALALLFLILLGLISAIIIYTDNLKSSSELKWGLILLAICFALIFIFGIWKNSKKIAARQKNGSNPKKTVVNVVVIMTIIIIFIVALIVCFKNIQLSSFSGWFSTPSATKTPEKSTRTATPSETKKASTSWDGNYDAQMTKPNCDSSVELTSFQVVNNKVVNLWGNDGPIDSGGNASLTFNTGTTMKVDFDFGATNGKKFASGTWSTSRGCTGTFSAMKTW